MLAVGAYSTCNGVSSWASAGCLAIARISGSFSARKASNISSASCIEFSVASEIVDAFDDGGEVDAVNSPSPRRSLHAFLLGEAHAEWVISRERLEGSADINV